VEAAQEQLSAIHRLMEAGVLETLPAKLKQAAYARENNPSASLSELAAMMEPAITKPAMNNRMKKLIQLSKEARA
jgi:DNA-binding protein WhiA